MAYEDPFEELEASQLKEREEDMHRWFERGQELRREAIAMMDDAVVKHDEAANFCKKAQRRYGRMKKHIWLYSGILTLAGVALIIDLVVMSIAAWRWGL